MLGSGISGTAAARLATRRGHRVTVYDSDPGAGFHLLSEGMAVVTGDWSDDLLSGIDVVVTSPGVPERSAPLTAALEHRVPVWSELEFASHHLDSPIVAVTGTNGKTTVTGLVHDMLAGSGVHTTAAGNIGTALSDVVDEAWQVVVVEASSFQLRFIDQFHAEVAVVLNVADDHLDWHGSFANYLAAKARILENQTPEDAFVYDRDDAAAAGLADQTPARWIGVSGVEAGPDGIGRTGDVLSLGRAKIPLDELSVSDRAYLVDLAAAAAAAGCAGASEEAIEQVVRSFRPGAHRREVVGVIDGVPYINDSKGTNPHASLAAVEAYPSVVLIAGGRNKGLDLRPLAVAPAIRHLIVMGEAADELAASAIAPSSHVDSMDDAVAEARRIARPGDVVLMSPGCASFDMFTDYRDRGEAFASIVAELNGEEASP